MLCQEKIRTSFRPGNRFFDEPSKAPKMGRTAVRRHLQRRRLAWEIYGHREPSAPAKSIAELIWRSCQVNATAHAPRLAGAYSAPSKSFCIVKDSAEQRLIAWLRH